MSLTTCIKQAGSALRPADKAAILALSRTYRADGLSPDEAGKKAIAEQISAVQKLMAKEQAKEAKPVADEAPTLTSPTKADILTQQQAKEDGEKASAKAKHDTDKKLADEQTAKDNASRFAGAVDNFKLGETADQNLRGQGGMFDAPVMESAPEAPLPRPASTGSGIADFGEKLGGARKDQAPSLKAEVSDDDLVSKPFSKVWPADEYLEMDDLFASAVAFTARAEVPAKPRVGYKVNSWVSKVKIVRSLAQMVASGQVTQEKFKDKLQMTSGLTQFGNKIALLEAIPREQWKRIGAVESYPDSYRYDADGKQVKTPFVRVMVDDKNHNFNDSNIPDVLERVMELLGVEAKGKLMQFEVRGRAGGSVNINKKGDPNRRSLKTFGAATEAFDFIKNNYDDLLASWEGVKERDNVGEADVRNAENRPRTGADHRKGKDVDAETFAKAFGFRGIEFGNWVAQGANSKERQGMLNGAYDALLDLAEIINVPPQALSLNGTLGLGFGSRGSGGASAHYEPDTLVINLTKTRGAGTLAHEWFHAMDNHFSHKRGLVPMARGMTQQDYRAGNYITYKPEPMMVHKTARSSPVTKSRLADLRKSNPGASYLAPENWQVDPKHPAGVRPEVEQRFADLVAALDASPMKARASAIDKGTDGYWSRIIERAARSFENYIITKMRAEGYQNDYLANVREVQDFPRDRARYPYLMPEEIGPIVEAFDALFSTIQTKQTADGGVEMFSIADDQTDTPAFKKWFDKSVVVDADGKPLVVYHGTAKSITEFSNDKGRNLTAFGDAQGFYFTDNPEVADGYGYAAAKKADPVSRTGSVTYPVFLSLKNPDIRIGGRHNSASHTYISPQERAALEAKGFDGVIYKDPRDSYFNEYIAFKSEQIKSATGNNGAFDGKNPDIRMSVANTQKAYTPPNGLQAAPARQQQLADQLAARLNGNLNAGRVPTVLHAVTAGAGDTSDRARSLAAVAVTAKRLFGHEVVFVDFGGSPLFNGAMSRAIPGVVFIRVDSPKPHMAILGHELLHQLRASNPGLYNSLDAALTPLLAEKGASEFLDKLGAGYKRHGLPVPNNWDEELWADVTGDNFMDPEFLQALGAEQPALFKRVVDAITQFLNTIITKLSASNMQPFGTRQYLTDAKAAREAVAKAFREFSGTQVGAMTDQRETVAMSIADKQGGRSADDTTPGARFHLLFSQAVETVAKIEALAEKHGKVYIRWSASEQHDMKPGAASRDYVSGETHAGLSAVEITSDTHPVTIAKRLSEYGFGRMTNKSERPKVYLADRVGTDSDGYPSINPSKKLMDISDEVIAALDAKFSQAFDLQDNIQDAEKRLEKITDQNARAITQKSLDEKRVALKKIINVFPNDPATPSLSIANKPLQTETAAFKKWFGDSKVVDAKGEPLVVYHGTGADFSEFSLSKFGATDAGWFGKGFYFTDDKKIARNYGKVMSVYLSIKKPLPSDNAGFDPATVKKIIDQTKTLDPEFSPTDWLAEDISADKKAIDQLEGMYRAGAAHSKVLQALTDVTGFDGVVSKGIYIAFRPVQIKSAIGNSGAFDPTNPDISLSIAQPGLFQPNIWSTPGPNTTAFGKVDIDKLIYNVQDGKIDLRRTQEAILKSGQTIAEQYDARLAETLYPGRVAHRSQTFLEVEAQPLLKAMHSNKVGMDELADYLHARGAEERNVQIAKVNPAMPDGGAGTNTKGTLLTTQAAKDYLTGISPVRKLVLDAMAKRVDAITAGTRTLLVSEGLEKQDTIDAWTAVYKNYVPMFRDEADEGFPSHPQGSGFTVKGSASKRAMGSKKEVTNILAHVLMQREAAITRAEKNRVALALYGQALSHPNPEFWATIKPGMQAAAISSELVAMGVDPMTAEVGMAGVPTVQTIDPNSGKVVNRPNPMYKMLPGAIPLKVNGEDRVLMLNVKNERGARLAESLKNLDGLTNLDLAGSIVGKSTRWLAAVNTQYNPAFGLANLTRDTLGGVIHLGNTELRGNALKVLAQTPMAILGIARELATGKQAGKWGKLYQQFVADGGQTGFKENFRDPNDRAKAIEKELKAIGRGALSPGKYAHAALDLLDGFNTTLENAVRLSAYSAALDKGISRPQAARLGRELTVDFNRKGRLGREVGPLYAFFNASVQGMARTMQAIKGPTGGKIIAGGLSLGILQALMLAAAGYDDDEIPEFVKTRALIIPLFGDKKEFISIPYPLGLHVLPNTGRVLTELVLNGGKDIGKRSVAAIGEIAGAFNPLGGGNILTADGALKTIAPTLIDPLIELGFNKNFAGNGIEKQGYGSETDNRPGVARTKESTQRSATGQAYMEISKALNNWTGGNDYEAGKVSPTPERIRYLAQTVGGGVLREIEKTINASTASARGDKVKSSQIPVLGRFYGEVDPDQVQTSRYYNKTREIDTIESSLKAAKKAGNGEAAMKIIEQNPEAALITTQNRIATEISKLNKMAVETINDPAMLRQIDEARVARMSSLNQAVEMLEKQAGKTTPAEEVRKAAVKAGWK